MFAALVPPFASTELAGHILEQLTAQDSSPASADMSTMQLITVKEAREVYLAEAELTRSRKARRLQEKTGSGID